MPERGIYWAYLGENIGYEQDGGGNVFTRPVVVIKGYSKELLLCAPISHTIKHNSKFYHRIKCGEKIDGSVIISQLRAIDVLRLGRIIDTLSRENLQNLKQAIIDNITE